MAKRGQRRTKTKRVKRGQRKTEARALVVSQVSLTPTQTRELAMATPPQFVKRRKTRGGQMVNYVEGGYMVARLNQVFNPINWNWEILEHGTTERKVDSKAEGEVWVRGRLTVKDHVRGFNISKDAFGQHPIHPNVPIGDALKSASTDAMKKAAAQGFGIALDIYWPQLDSEGEVQDKAPKVEAMTRTDAFEKAKEWVAKENNRSILQQGLIKVNESKLFTNEQKDEIKRGIYAKLEAK